MLSGLSKHKISVETTSLADGDSIAAYLTSAAGALITSETIGASEYSHAKGPSEFAEGVTAAPGDFVGVAGGINADGNYQAISVDNAGAVQVTGSLTVIEQGIYAEDSAHVSGDKGVFSLSVRRDVRSSGTDANGDYASINVNAVGELWVKDADSYTELLAQGTTLNSILSNTNTLVTNSASIVTNTANTATNTGNTASTLAALSKAEDAVASSGDQGIQALAVRKDASGSNAADGDYTSLQTWIDGGLKTVSVANAAISQSQIAVTNTAAAISPLAGRKTLEIQNTGSTPVYVGSATVTTSGATTGIEIPKGGNYSLDVGPAVSVYLITASTGTVNILQAA